MGRLLLVCRLAAKDLRRRRGEAVMLLLAIMAATTTLTLGLLLYALTSHPYESTRAATAGPDVVASVFPPQPVGGPPAHLAVLTPLAHAPGVTGHSGPYPVTWAVLRTHGLTAGAMVEGRDQAPASVDQPKLTQGSWIRNGGVVVERSFAEALGIGAGDRITLNDRSFRVVGVAVTAAALPYPDVCFNGCDLDTPQLSATNPGLIWLTRAAARSLATRSEMLSYFMNLRLADPARANAFVSAQLEQLDRTRSELLAGHRSRRYQAGRHRKECPADRQLAAWPARGGQRGCGSRRPDGGADPPGRTA